MLQTDKELSNHLSEAFQDRSAAAQTSPTLHTTGRAAPVKGQKRVNKDHFNQWYKHMTGKGPAKTTKG